MQFNKYRLAGVFVVTLFVLSPAACKTSDNLSANATIRLADTHSTRKLEADLFGTNIQWEHRGDGILETTDTEPKFHDDAIAMIKRLHLSSIRFPGGSLSDTYQWWNTVGPVAERAKGLSFAKEVVASNFGTDELLALSRKLDAKAVLTVNFNWSNQRAADWVKYVNRPKKKPGKSPARYWEIGNEIYSPNESGHTTAPKYARRVNEFATAMKAADPGIKVGAVAEVSFLQTAWMENIYPHMVTWNAEVIESLSKDIDFLSIHFYAPFDKVSNSDDLSRLVLSGPLVFRDNLEIIREELRKSGRTDMRFAVTEYNTFFGDALKVDPRTASPESALFQALILFEMSAQEDIVLANNWSLLNNGVFGMLEVGQGGGVAVRPAFNVFEKLSLQQGNWLVELECEGPTYSIAAKGNIPSLDNVPYLGAMATEGKDGTRFLNLVNRSPDTAISLDVNGLAPDVTYARIEQWHGTETDKWSRSHAVNEVRVDGISASILLPAFSFTTVELRTK